MVAFLNCKAAQLGFALTLQEQVADASDTSDATEARRLAAQCGPLVLIKRIFILHARITKT